MSFLTLIGWSVVHSLWVSTLVAGITALILSLIGDRLVRLRNVLSCVALAGMAILPIAAALMQPDLLGPSTRRPLTRFVESTITLQSLVTSRSLAVRAAGLIWLAGAGVCLVRVAREWRFARQLRSSGRRDAADPVRALVETLRGRLRLRSRVDVGESARAAVPMVIGWRQPVILLPPSAVVSLSAAELRGILTHELAHVQRRDYLINLFQIAVDTILWHHPGARWVSSRIRTDREYCCDDVAVALGGDVGVYARALASLEDARGSMPGAGGDNRLVVAAASGTLLDRLQRLAGRPRPTFTPARGVAALLVATVVAGVMVALSMTVPPRLPLDVKLRSRTPPPAQGR